MAQLLQEPSGAHPTGGPEGKHSALRPTQGAPPMFPTFTDFALKGGRLQTTFKHPSAAAPSTLPHPAAQLAGCGLFLHLHSSPDFFIGSLQVDGWSPASGTRQCLQVPELEVHPFILGLSQLTSLFPLRSSFLLELFQSDWHI